MMPSAIFPDLKGRSVLITGGGTGIGASLTEGFVRQGSRVAFIDIAEAPSQALAEKLAADHGNRPLYLKADLRDVEALKAAVATAVEANGPVTVLVNNAAWDDRHDVDDVTVEYWDLNQSINLRPQFFAAQAVLPGMREAGGGSIVNFTSTSFMINHGGFPAYTAAKAGIVGLTKGLAGRLGPEKIRVNAIAPGWVITERQRELWVTSEGLQGHIDRQALREEIEPGDMVGPCLFLASDAARMLSAQVLIVDGGYL
ncbi:SDR family oxidoreductase [Phyllobacterium sp. 21LDTY02-6]|jgi:galactose dehydrogenase|uniref:SDR family NAD(P)-dependent oxidoreductase n=1 Tax=unclassified Phyllobacterium TaxID=2638441 RepID=UPI00201FF076|nr:MULTISPECIES: SDR family oxidoreductase [unclassified Phyllobacterium]MCO4319411.1 SDR family oxidoreductase [Phyllobacterium sp. 21LDTY02-6]MCX8279827.1 SDR family NAD(P)-dependent oxidoreductase [Phyllobacterium sp. 0TCS1.6C]MCX8295569.1 SDR family NAD(P)-dependent oxidoreductase [Phyllobacterium sp. 0TCS1.6A]